MNLADEITLNKIQQELISQEDAKKWFLRFPTEYQQEILQRLSYMTLQAGAREEDVSLAIAKSKLRPTYTPCVLLSRGRLKEQMAKLLKLPPSEFIKTFFLLMSLLAIADARRYCKYCQDGCSHWWHRDLSDRKVLDKIRRELQQSIYSPISNFPKKIKLPESSTASGRKSCTALLTNRKAVSSAPSNIRVRIA